jgi:predicted anti-sigma-YlaC factor YlaD
MTMNCQDFAAEMERFVDLHPDRLPESFRRHLEECPSCREEWQEAARLREDLASLRVELSAETMERLRSVIRGKIREASVTPSRRPLPIGWLVAPRPRLRWALAVAGVLALGLGVWEFRSWETQATARRESAESADIPPVVKMLLEEHAMTAGQSDPGADAWTLALMSKNGK